MDLFLSNKENPIQVLSESHRIELHSFLFSSLRGVSLLGYGFTGGSAAQEVPACAMRGFGEVLEMFFLIPEVGR